MNKLEQAFQTMKRSDFMREDLRNYSDTDRPFPIGFGQTISQPYTVAKMLEWLEVEPGNKILDVGSGSGWTTALLSYLTGPKGFVYAVEKIPELATFGRQNNQGAGVKNAKFFQAGDKYGLPKFAPYDRILVSAAAEQLPKDLVDQLKVGGKMVIPMKNDILEIEKEADDKLDIQTHPGFVFVPLVK